MSLAPWSVLQNRYEIIGVVGQGGHGAVYEAFDRRLQTRVAVKQLTYAGAGGAEIFEREARLLSQLRHPGLPRVSDHFSEASGQFLVMDFIEGRDLGGLLEERGGPLEVAAALAALDQLLGVVEYLHEHVPPILHRDIKPGNIKFPAKQLMLLDFGLAKGYSTTQNLSVTGYTPHYAPLEQMQGSGTEVRSDLYAVAATAYHLLTGQPPADALARAAASVRGRPDPLLDPAALNPAIPPALAAAILRDLSLDPDRRHPSASALRQTLRAIRPPAAAADPGAATPAAPVSSAGLPTIRGEAQPIAPLPPPAPANQVLAPLPEARPGGRGWLLVALSIVLLVLVIGAVALNEGYKRLRQVAAVTAEPSPPLLRPTVSPSPTLPAETRPLPPAVTIVSSLPRTGAFSATAQSIVTGITMRLDEDKNLVCGTVQVRYRDLDDATAAKGRWDEAQESLNAMAAANDETAMVYIGPYDSGAALISLPVLNQADLVMISPGNTYPGITKKGLGRPGEPELYYPAGERTYVRIVPTDELQGVAAARWAKALGAATVYVVEDGGPYGLLLSDAFVPAAIGDGLTILGRDSIDPRAASYAELAKTIRQNEPDLIYFSGIAQNNAAQLLKDLRAAGLTADTVKFMGSDGIREAAFLQEAGPAAEGIFLTSNSVPPDELKGTSFDWRRRYQERFGAAPDADAAYGYEAASVALAGLNGSCANLTRAAVRARVMETRGFVGLFGSWGFDENGDTTLRTMSGLRVRDGRFEFVQTVEAK